jgi:large subunit ribosomal protein L33
VSARDAAQQPPEMAALHREEEFNMPREQVTLQCSECKERNYTTMKNKKTTTERLEMSKFCPRCRKHKQHKEVK